MKKLFCKIGVVASLFTMVLFYSALAYGTMPAFIALCGTVLSFLSMRFCWENFVRLMAAERRRAQRMRVPLSRPVSVRPFHAA